MYIGIERQATNYIKGINHSLSITVPAFMVDIVNGKEVILVFLTKLIASNYFKSCGRENEFKVVTLQDMNLKAYRDNFLPYKERVKEFFPYDFQIVIDLIKDGDDINAVLFQETYSFYDIFCRSEEIKELIFRKNPESREVLLQDEKFNESEVMNGSKKFSEAEELEIKKNYEKNISENVGKIYPLVLIDKKGNFYAPIKAGKPTVCFFINKLDAAIVRQVEKNIGNNFDIHQMKGNESMFELLRIQNTRNIINFCMVYGFMTLHSDISPKWTSTNKNQEMPDFMAYNCSLNDVQNGIDIADYFYYITGDKERETALNCLIKTNLAATEEIDKLAQNTLLDMQSNTVQIADTKNHTIYHRLVFSS